MTPEETAAAVKAAVQRVGGAFMTAPETVERGRQLGYDPWGFYYAGRGGVLGDVDADVVAAVFAFMPATSVRTGWEKARAVSTPDVTMRHYAECCHHWARTHLAHVPGLDRLCVLARCVVDAADVAGIPLFAGWRSVPVPDDPPARAAHLLHVLREHRGGLHVVSVLATGLTPLEAVIAGKHGTTNAKFYGWPEPYPDPEPIEGRREAAEALTDELAGAAYAALDEGERDELADLAGTALAGLG